MSLSVEAQYQIRKAEQRLAILSERRDRLLARAHEAASVLRREFGARGVWLFGSLKRPWFHDASDVDLAVEGVDSARLGLAWDRVCQIIGASVDLVSLEEAPESLRRRIAESGEMIP